MGQCTDEEFPICSPMYIPETGGSEYRCSFYCDPMSAGYSAWKACQDMGGNCESVDVNFDTTCRKIP